MPQQTSIITFIKGDKMGAETDYRDALPVNMYAVNRPMFGAQGYMIQEPGLTLHANGSGIDRGGIWNERFKNHLRLSGRDFIEVDKLGNVSVLGSIGGTDTASLPYSFSTQAIIADGKYFLFDPANGFRRVTDPDVGSPIDAVWINGLYVFTDGEFLYRTEAGNESSIEPIKFATSEFSPDPTLGVGKTQDNKLMAFNRYSIEYFVDTADSTTFGFARLEARAIKLGTVGTHCKFELGGKWYVLGGRKEEGVSLHVIRVGSADKVSTREIDKLIGKYNEDELSKVVVEGYEEDGYSFILIHLPGETVKFNETIATKVGIENAWSIIRTDVTFGNRFDPQQWRGKHGIFEARLGQWVFGDKMTNKIGILDNTVATQYDDISEWLLFTPYLYLEKMSIDEIDLETIPGFTGSEDATVFISLSYNGVTFGKEWTELYGLPNDYSKNFIIRRLGNVNQWLGIKLRGATRSRMAFGKSDITYG